MQSPIRDNCFYVDNSTIELITTCPWLAYASIIRQRRPAMESSALRFGGFIHQALELRHRMLWMNQELKASGMTTKVSEAEIENAQIKLLSDLFTASPLESEGWRNLAAAVLCIRGYNAQYPLAGQQHLIATNPMNGRALVEQPFACDTHTDIHGLRVIYTGRIDAAIRTHDNQHFVWDVKTSSVLGDDTWADWSISEQFRGYCWALRECTGIEPTGYYVDAIGARQSIENARYDDVMRAVVPTSEKSKAVPLELIRQPYFTQVPPGQIDEWFANMLNQVRWFLSLYGECGDSPAKWEHHRHHKHCIGKYGKCRFFNVCSLPDPAQRESALTSAEYKDEDWSPLYL
jgi:hypothetical protein